MKFASSLLSLASLSSLVLAETHHFQWNATYLTENPDGLAEVSDIVGCNGAYPWPTINVTKGDRVVIDLYNGLGVANTSIHFHGLFQHHNNKMDGVPGLTQCEIPPGESFTYNFTVPDQVGTFWYHSHSKGQYMDGMRGAFIISDPENPYAGKYDEEKVIELSEWYHDNITTLTESFLNVFNPTGAEPIPQTLLMNGYMNGTLDVEPDKTYLLRIINVGGFVSQYFSVEDHNLTIVAVDGVYVEPNETEVIYITVAQRYDVLLKTKKDMSRNYAMMQLTDMTMLDTPTIITANVTNNLQYDALNGWPEEIGVDIEEFFDDFWLTPVHDYETYDDFDHQITIDVVMDNLNNGINYAFFNNITYVAPKVPALGTVLSAPNDTVSLQQAIYGSNTHSFVLQKDEIVEIVLNNNDTGKHPFHLHGHVFQVVERGPDYGDAADPVNYNESAPYTPRDRPMVRDTLYVNPQSYFVIRFKADNPGVWFFHCHIEWHLLQGLAIVMVEDPAGIRANETALPEDWKDVCNSCGGHVGNAANNSVDFFNLAGENVQVVNLPAGFTTKGIVALVFSCVSGVLGCVAIGIYGMADIPNMEEKVIQDLDIDERKLLEEMDEQDNVEESNSSSGRYSDDGANGKRFSDDVNTTSKRYSDDTTPIQEYHELEDVDKKS